MQNFYFQIGLQCSVSVPNKTNNTIIIVITEWFNINFCFERVIFGVQEALQDLDEDQIIDCESAISDSSEVYDTG